MIIGIISSKDSLALICGAVFSFARRFLLLRVLQEKSSMKEMTFEEVVKRVATKGGITQEGTAVVYEKLPDVADELFEKTLAKRRLVAEKAKETYGL